MNSRRLFCIIKLCQSGSRLGEGRETLARMQCLRGHKNLSSQIFSCSISKIVKEEEEEEEEEKKEIHAGENITI
jgi:hypothetical protein